MAEQNTQIGSMDALFKTVYHNKVENLIPDFTQVQGKIKFDKQAKVGELYRMPVTLAAEQAITYASGESEALEAFTLIDPIAGNRVKADIKSSEMLLRSSISYKAAYSGDNAKAAFHNSTYDLVMNMNESIRRRLEIDLIYGQSPLGVVASVASDVVTITAASWAPGIWAGMKGAHIQCYATGGTALNVGFNADAGDGYGTYTKVVSVDLENRQITVDDAQNIIATDDIYFKSALRTPHATASSRVFGSMLGIYTQVTTSDPFFGIDPGDYELWSGNTVAAGGAPLTFAMFLRGAAMAQAKGAVNEFCAFVNPFGWQDLMSDLSALRRYDSSNKVSKITMGSDEIEFHTGNGTIKIKSHPCIKEGEAIVIAPAVWKRIGATDVTFRRPNMGGKVSTSPSFFRELTDKAGFELRAYSDQSIFSRKPGLNFAITGIVNSTTF